ncbi:MAG: class II aldolase/adducin family protein [Candidatus Thorarchaeota archaeon]|nr:class II aldolase/adducin family protein [Candidatus Thorarchaeota archaeon]
MYEATKQEIVDTCLWLTEHGMVVGSSGNVSVRVDDHVVITPSSVKYDKMAIDDIMVLDTEGRVLEGAKTPSIETPTHLRIYKRRRDARAVVHTHSVYASALAVLGMPLPPVLDEIVPKIGGEVRVASYAMPGTDELAEAVVDALEGRSGVLMANHGALTCGRTLEEALDLSVLLDRACRIYLLALSVGTPRTLSKEVIEVESQLWAVLRNCREE